MGEIPLYKTATPFPQVPLPPRLSHARPFVGVFKGQFDSFFRKRGRFSPNVDKNEEMAPRTRTGYPHEEPFMICSNRRAYRFLPSLKCALNGAGLARPVTRTVALARTASARGTRVGLRTIPRAAPARFSPLSVPERQLPLLVGVSSGRTRMNDGNVQESALAGISVELEVHSFPHKAPAPPPPPTFTLLLPLTPTPQLPALHAPAPRKHS